MTSPREHPGHARPRRRRRTRIVIVIASAIAVIGIGILAVWLFAGRSAPADDDRTALAVYADTAAAQNAASETEGSDAQLAAAYLALQPTAMWLVPERDPVGRVGERVAALADEADAQGAASTIVVYGLPGRDCGNHSAGGLAPDEYAVWTEEIGAAVRESGVTTIIVLEPDSIALAEECGNLDERADELQGAVANLASDVASIYIDGGHSNWHPASAMAGFIREMGVIDDVRGFATNVSNYNADDDEISYAKALSRLLGGAHAVIDTGRNGAGSTGEWCNPRERRVGTPAGTLADDVVDANLWIKVPGESDGPCNGGPAAGQWWSEIAIELTRDAVP